LRHPIGDERGRVINIPKHVFQDRQWTVQAYNSLSSDKAHKEKVKQPYIPVFYPMPAELVSERYNEKPKSNKCCKAKMNEQ
jgi:hypothetical protein